MDIFTAAEQGNLSALQAAIRRGENLDSLDGVIINQLWVIKLS